MNPPRTFWVFLCLNVVTKRSEEFQTEALDHMNRIPMYSIHVSTLNTSNNCFVSCFSRSGLHGQIFKGKGSEEGPVEGSATAETQRSSTWQVYKHMGFFTSWFMQWSRSAKIIWAVVQFWQNMKKQPPRKIWWLEIQNSKDEFGQSCMAVAGHGMPEGRL